MPQGSELSASAPQANRLPVADGKGSEQGHMPRAASCKCRADRQRQTPQWRGPGQETQTEAATQASSLPVPTVLAPCARYTRPPCMADMDGQDAGQKYSHAGPVPGSQDSGQARLAWLTCSRWQMYRHKAALHGRQASALGMEQQEGAIRTGCPGQESAAGDCAQGQGKDGKARLATVPAPCRKEHTASTGPAGIPTVRASLFLGSAQVASVRTLGSQGMADAAPSVLPRAQGLAEQQPGWHVLPCHGAQDG